MCELRVAGCVCVTSLCLLPLPVCVCVTSLCLLPLPVCVCVTSLCLLPLPVCVCVTSLSVLPLPVCVCVFCPIREQKKYRVFIVLPILPGFVGDITQGGGNSIQASLHYTYKRTKHI